MCIRAKRGDGRGKWRNLVPWYIYPARPITTVSSALQRVTYAPVPPGQASYPTQHDDIYILLQVLNLTQALQDGKSPLQLVQMPVVTVERRKAAYGRSRIRNDSLEDTLTQKFSTRSPFFSWCWVCCRCGILLHVLCCVCACLCCCCMMARDGKEPELSNYPH